MEIRPSNRTVVHHVLAYIIFPLTRLKEQPPVDGINGYVGIYLPGEGPTIFPEDTGKYVPAGATIAFQIHYTAVGREAEDQTQIGFIWAKKKPSREVVTHSAKNVHLKIPPGAADHLQEGTHTFAHDTKLLSLLPHLHVRGKAFKYVAVSPDGTEEVLLDVPRYDFNWQIRYWFKEPKLLKAGTSIRVYARFDNSKNNPFNPDPTKEVHWGPQTWDEMLVGYMDFIKAD